MARLAPKLSGILLILALCDGTPTRAAPSPAVPAPASPVSSARAGISWIDVNELRMAVTNVGMFGYSLPVIEVSQSGIPGLEWPRGSGRSLLYAGGLWVGARVNGEPRVTVAEYGTEYAAGPLDATGQPVDPNESDNAHRVYKIRRGDDASNPDWAQWPIALGAPDDGAGNPRVIGDQTLWSVYNDAVAAKHKLPPGRSTPLGLEVRQTVFGYDRPGPLGRMVFLEFEIFNRSPDLLADTYIGFWCDPDLGGGGDDLVACDPALNLGYCYNGSATDYLYGGHAPAVGIALLKGPLTQGVDLPMTGFGRLLKNFLEPDTPLESYARFQGIREDGMPQTCDGVASKFEVSADPVMTPPPPDTSFPPASCLDLFPADRRFLLSTGPFDFPAGTAKRVVIAVVVGGRDGIGDRLSNIERLRSYARVAREVYNRDFVNIGAAGEVDPGDLYLGYVNEALGFDGRRSQPGSGPPPHYIWEYGDGSINPGIGLQPAHSYASGGQFKAMLHAFDSDIPVSCGVKVDIYDPGATSAEFADATWTGLARVQGTLAPVYAPLFEGVSWGGRFYDGGLDTGCRWSGSSITGEISERPICPGAVHAPHRFKSVRLEYGTPHKAYRYFRRELASGAEPAAGRGYTYQGYVDIPFRAVADVGGNPVELQVMFTERQISDDSGDGAGLRQPPSQDGTWFPTLAADGDHEYLSILDIPYSATPDPALMVDGAFFAGTAPVLFGGHLRRNPAGDLRVGAGVAFTWVSGADPGPGVDVAWGQVGNRPAYFISNGDGTSRLFQYQEGFSRFVDFTSQIPSSLVGRASSAAWGDFDGDGLTDLYVLGSSAPNVLLRQASPGAFGEAIDPILAGLGTSVHAAWADYDLDRELDLYVVEGPNPNRLLRKHPGGFVDVTSGPLAGAAQGVRAVWVDFDGDFDPDLCLANGFAGGQLLRNDRAAGFVDATPADFLGSPLVDAAWADYDLDGDLDAYLVRDGGQSHVLLRNDGGTFTRATPASLRGDGAGRRAVWLDYDLDADLDLGVVDWVTGFHLMRNDGNGAFVDISRLLPALPALPNAIGVADYDLDGDPDFHLAGSGNDMLVRNDLASGRWVQIALRGWSSDPNGLGARIRVGARGVIQTQFVTAADPPPLAATFGLGGADVVDLVEVTWPSGVVTRATAVPVFSRITLDENPNRPPGGSYSLAVGRVVPNPSRDVTAIELLIPPGVEAVDLAIHDVSGRRLRRGRGRANGSAGRLFRARHAPGCRGERALRPHSLAARRRSADLTHL